MIHREKGEEGVGEEAPREQLPIQLDSTRAMRGRAMLSKSDPLSPGQLYLGVPLIDMETRRRQFGLTESYGPRGQSNTPMLGQPR